MFYCPDAFRQLCFVLVMSMIKRFDIASKPFFLNDDSAKP